MSLRIKNFERFQHYRNRNPPWVKLYTQLLDDVAFLALSDAARGQLMLLWLLAARMGNPLPDDARLLAGKIGSSGRLQLEELVAAGWLIREDASTTLAPGAADNASTLLAPSRARARDRDRGERQRQNKHPPTHPPAACVSDSAMNGTNGGKPGRVDPDGFPEAWAAYPRREGGNPRGAAVR